MRLSILTAAVAALSLSACSSFQGLSPEIQKAALEQYGSRCNTHLFGSTGLGAAAGFDVDCQRTPAVTPGPIVQWSPEARAQLDDLIAQSVAKALASKPAFPADPPR